MEIATFGAGCFWHMEEVFRQAQGVVSTQVGYMGGSKENPTYEEVCSHTTGHAEVVEVTFDPSRISFDGLLQLFWDHHDPTQLNRQGPDVGSNLSLRNFLSYHGAADTCYGFFVRGTGLRQTRSPHRHRDCSGSCFLAGGGVSPAACSKRGGIELPPLAKRWEVDAER